MTRDEADKINTETRGFIDTLVALGVLKLDEPQGVGAKFDAAMRDLGPFFDPHCDIWNAIHRAGLKIVEK